MMQNGRPLSPDLQIYRPQLTSVMSISHRVTGVALSAGSVLLVFWLIAAASAPQAYSVVQGLLSALPGRILLLVWSFFLFFHLCNGIRHLVWDAGYGFELKAIYVSGWTVLTASAALTLAVWIACLFLRG